MKPLSNTFVYTKQKLCEISQKVLEQAKKFGATDAVTEISESYGLSVMTRCEHVEKVEYQADKTIEIGVFFAKRRGYATTSDFSDQAIVATVKAACNIARLTAEDSCAGLPEKQNYLSCSMDLKLFFPWTLTVNEAVDIARQMEKKAFSFDEKIKNSDGASVSTFHRQFVLANTDDFIDGYAISRHCLSCAPVAISVNGMQRDSWYSMNLDPEKLQSPLLIGQRAASRALARLGATSIATQKCPVLFEAPVAASLLNCFVNAISGAALYRKATFLLDSLGKQIFPKHINLYEDPLVISGPASTPFDEEGVQTRSRVIIENGVLQGYFLSTYSARKLGMETTGNAGGAHNLYLSSVLTQKSDDLDIMLRKLGTGLFVTELMGDGVNLVTGDYSRCASGFWVENGKISFPVEEVTIASNLSQMFMGIIAVGADQFCHNNKFLGSILIDNMTVAGHAERRK